MITVGLYLAVLFLALTSQGRWRLWVSGLALPAMVVVANGSLPIGVGAAAIAVAFGIGTFGAWFGVMPAPMAAQIPIAVGSGVTVGIAVLFARVSLLAAPVIAPVVLAVLIAASEYAGASRNPFGEWGSLAHSQARTPWGRFVARRGPAAVTFFVMLASSGFGFWYSTGESTAVAVSIFALVVVSVAMSIARPWREFSEAIPEVVGLVEHEAAMFTLHLPQFVESEQLGDAWWSTFERNASDSLDELLERTEQAALDGAQLVVWAEGAGITTKGQYDEAVATASDIAMRTGCVLVCGWITLDQASHTMSNTATVIDADGTIVMHYDKRHPVPGPEANATVSTKTPVVAADTAVGRLAVVICFDADHPDIWKEIDAVEPELVVVPASDWEAIAALHSEMAVMRARSSSVALVRIARDGISTTSNSGGRTVELSTKTRSNLNR